MALTDNLVAAYKLDDVTDGTENGYDLTNNNSVAFNAGKIGDAADFGTGNTNKKLSIASTLGISSGAITISWWTKTPATLADMQGIVFFMKNGGFAMGAMWNAADTLYAIGSTTDPNGAVSMQTNFGLSTNTWYHIVITSDGTTGTLYVDNTSYGTWAHSTTVGNADYFGIGENYRADWETDGMIDSCYVWSRVITSDERATMYNSGNGYEIDFGVSATGNFFQLF